MKLLFITNGHGEDIIGARIIKELRGNDISVMPVVGSGDVFEGLGAKILGPRKKFPSGGFVYQSLLNIARDLFAGLIGNTVSQIRELRSLKGAFDLVVSIGDIVPIIGALQTKTKFIFVGCAKSDYYDYSYTPWEKHFLKKYCLMCFPRDQKTHDDLSGYGIKSMYVGNPMMDCMDMTGNDMGIGKDTTVIGILPGTRDDAGLNMQDIAAVAGELNKLADAASRKLIFLVAAAPITDTSSFQTTRNTEIVKGKFGDVLNRSDLVIGLSGTGNEQAAGLGKPVVSFPGRGVQYTASFARRQKQLLGDALLVVKNDPLKAASAIWELLNNKAAVQKMASEGRARMGGPGASAKIAEFIKNENRI